MDGVQTVPVLCIVHVPAITRPSHQASGENVKVYVCVSCGWMTEGNNIGRDLGSHKRRCRGQVVWFHAGKM